MKISNKGFSLLEVIIAMAIFAIGAGGLYGMQITSAKGNTKANQQTGAIAAGTQFVEFLMKTNFTNAALAPNGNPHNAAGDFPALLTSVQRTAPYVSAVSWNVTDLGATDSEYSGIFQVNLTVTYTQNRQVNLSFLRIRMI
jgi:prepilin-type N-terminal cleavage/methylation domain-containing protein